MRDGNYFEPDLVYLETLEWQVRNVGVFHVTDLVFDPRAGPVVSIQPCHDASWIEIGQSLLSMRGSPELVQLSDERLGPLLDLPGERGRDLLDTLEVFLRSVGRKTEAAAPTEIERQSLYHRLSRIDEELDVNLKAGDTVLALNLAVMVRRLLCP